VRHKKIITTWLTQDLPAVYVGAVPAENQEVE